jgi:hypothetical protein
MANSLNGGRRVKSRRDDPLPFRRQDLGPTRDRLSLPSSSSIRRRRQRHDRPTRPESKRDSLGSISSGQSDTRYPSRRRAFTSVGKGRGLLSSANVPFLTREYARDSNGSSLFLSGVHGGIVGRRSTTSRRTSSNNENSRRNPQSQQSAVTRQRPKRSSTVKRLLLTSTECDHCLSGERSMIERTDVYLIAHISAFCSGRDALALSGTSHTIALSLAITSAPLAAAERVALRDARKYLRRADPYNVTLALAEIPITNHTNVTLLQCCLERRVRAVCGIRTIQPRNVFDWLSLVIFGARPRVRKYVITQ